MGDLVVENEACGVVFSAFSPGLEKEEFSVCLCVWARNLKSSMLE